MSNLVDIPMGLAGGMGQMDDRIATCGNQRIMHGVVWVVRCVVQDESSDGLIVELAPLDCRGCEAHCGRATKCQGVDDTVGDDVDELMARIGGGLAHICGRPPSAGGKYHLNGGDWVQINMKVY